MSKGFVQVIYDGFVGGDLVRVGFELGEGGGGQGVGDLERGGVTDGGRCSVRWCLFGGYFDLGIIREVRFLRCAENVYWGTDDLEVIIVVCVYFYWFWWITVAGSVGGGF